MNEIFDSPEFLAFEKLCQAKKVSFLVSVSKHSSVHKPRKGPQYVMSDFFVHDIPEAWEQSGIRATPPETWLNPSLPPPLSLPLSQLVHNTAKLRKNFLAVWNHLHGVMTETYFCPKLYLTRIPRAEVEVWMKEVRAREGSLPPGEFLSCCDLCHFPAFAKWVLSPLAENENKANIKIQLSFLALMIALAMKLYNLDPEKHIKGNVSKEDQVNGDSDQLNSKTKVERTENKIDENITERTDCEKKKEGETKITDCHSPDKGSPKLRLKPISELKLCPTAAIADDVEIIPLEELPRDDKGQENRVNFIPTSASSILQSILGTSTSVTLTSVVHKDPTTSNQFSQPRSSSKLFPDVTSISPVSGPSSTLPAISLLTSLSNSVNTAMAPPSIIDLVDDDPPLDSSDVIQILSDDDEPMTKETSVISISSSAGDKDVTNRTGGKVKDTARDNDQDNQHDKVDIPSPQSKANSVVTISSSVEEDIPPPYHDMEEEPQNIMVEKAIHGEKTKDNEKEIDSRPDCHKNAVSVSLGRLIQICVKLLTQDEYRKFSRKVSKYLNSLPEESSRFPELTTYINAQSELLKKDSKNVFVYIKLVFEKIKNKKIEPKSGNEKRSSVHEDRPSALIAQTNKTKEITKSTVQDEPNMLDEKAASSPSDSQEKNATNKTPENTDVDSDMSENLLLGKEIDLHHVLSEKRNVNKKYPENYDNSSSAKSLEDMDTTDQSNDLDTDVDTTICFQEVDPEQKDLLEHKTLKEILTEFLGSCREKVTGKVFSSNFKNILDLMNTLDPSNLNSLSLKLFINNLHRDVLSDRDTISCLEAAAGEIERYQKGKKRPLKESQESHDLQQASKRRRQQESNSNAITGIEMNGSTSKEEGAHAISCESHNKKRAVLTSLSLVPTSGASKASGSEEETLEPAKRAILSGLSLVPTSEDASSKLSESNGVELNYVEPEQDKNPTHEMEGKEAASLDKKDNKKKRASGKHIKKLEAALKKCSKEIRRLEEAEVDWDNEEEEESNYVLCAKYKRRYMQLHRKIAEYKQMSSSLDRKCDKKFRCTESRYPEINVKIQKFINKTKQFPDFQDIKALVLEANKELHLGPAQVHEEAQDIFRSVGQRLKGRREVDETEVMLSYLPLAGTEDPAAGDQELHKVLVEQAKEGKQRMAQYLDDFYTKHVLGGDTKEQLKMDNFVERDNNITNAAESSQCTSHEPTGQQ